MQTYITQIRIPLTGKYEMKSYIKVRMLVQYSTIIARGSTKSHIVSASINLALSTRSGFLTTGNDSSFSSSLSSIIALTLLRLLFSGSSNYAALPSALSFTAINCSNSTLLCSLWLGEKGNNLSGAKDHLGSLSGSCTVTLLLRSQDKTFYNSHFHIYI